MKNIMKVIALVMCLILSLGSIVYAQEPVLISTPMENDYEGHWAQATIEKWLNAGKISGDPDGNYRPDDYVTRAEFVRMANSIIDYNEKADITYKDIGTNDWFYDYIRVAQKLGYISGYSSEAFGPNDNITREQAASIAARIQYLDDYGAGLENYTDMNKISEWAKGALGAASNAGFIKGYEDGSVKPLNFLTRAEALTMLDNILVNAKNVIIYKGDMELKDIVIEGDLIIARTAGTGWVKLTNAVINGRIRIFGGQVTFSGKYKSVIASGDSDLNFDDGEIEDLTVNEPIVLRGKGKIISLRANANGIKYEKEIKIEKIILGSGVTEEPAPLEEEVPIIGGGGGGGGGGPVVPTTKNPNIQIRISSPDGAYTRVFNTEKFSKNELIYNAMIAILNNDSYKNQINSILELSVSRMDNIQVDGLRDLADIWNKFEGYLTGTSIDLSELKTAVVINKDVDVSHVVAALQEINNSENAGKIFENIEADDNFNDLTFKYNEKLLTYTITSTVKDSLPSTYTDIADFLINEILVQNKKISEFLEEYGTVTITAVLEDSDKTASISIGLKDLK